MTAPEIELAVGEYFNVRTNVIVPNISWGMFIHECDLLVLTPAGYAYEVEIKTSKSDLIADKQKSHGHKSNLIKFLYFAIPSNLLPCIEHIPERAGVIEVYENSRYPGYIKCRIIRKPEVNKLAKKWNDKDKFNLARLGTMRMWPLKHSLLNLMKEQRNRA